MNKPLHILIVEDSEDDALLLMRELRKGGYELVSERVETSEDMKAALEQGKWDIVVSDYVLPGFSGLSALNILKESGQDLPFIIVSGNIGEDIAVKAMKAGAHDYIIKGNLARLVPAVERELREADVRREKREAEEELRRSYEELERRVEERTEQLSIALDERERLLNELMRSNKELEQFAYIASHDLQEPLRMVSSYVQLISHRYKGRLDKDADEFIGYAVDGATHMKTLLNDLLAYSRVGTKGGSFKLISLQAPFDRALINLKVEIDQTGAGITHENLPTVYADEVQMVQVFQNLLGNAMKFCKSGAPRITVSAEMKDDEWVVRVKDEGIGIDPKYFERIFHIFKRLHSKEEYRGTGIGLAICKKIIERHNGRIWVESESGEGASFNFTIPVKKER